VCGHVHHKFCAFCGDVFMLRLITEEVIPYLLLVFTILIPLEATCGNTFHVCFNAKFEVDFYFLQIARSCSELALHQMQQSTIFFVP
jgi:hypothetical protein